MKKGWVQKTLGDKNFFKILDGDRGKNYPKKTDFLKDGHCIFMNTGNVRPNGFDFSNIIFISKEKDLVLRKGKLQRNDVVMTTRGTVGNLGWYSSRIEYEHLRINSGMVIFRSNQKKILPEYLFIILCSPAIAQQIKKKSSGAAQPQLPIKTLITFEIPIPPLAEQKEIVAVLDAVFAAIDKAIDSIKKNIANANELFQSKLNATFTKKGKGWVQKTLGEVCEIVGGGTPKTNFKEYWNGKIAWITPADLGKLLTREVSLTSRAITPKGLQKSSAKLFPAHSVILSSRAPIGHLAINVIPMATNQGCRGIVPNNALENVFLFYFLKNNILLLNELGTGTTFKELSTKSLSSVQIPIPPLAEQKEIVEVLEQLSARNTSLIATYNQKLANLEELKKSLLQKAFAGELSAKK